MIEGTSTILLVEDEDHDAEFLQRAFLRAGIQNPVRVVHNGEEAVAYLCGNGKYADRKAFPFPRVMITDLKMPLMGGLELLRWIEENPKYRVVPTIVLSSSTTESDVKEAFLRGAAGYMVKPVGIGQLEEIAKVIADYWRTSLVPRHEE